MQDKNSEFWNRNRRSFLKTFGGAAAGSIILPTAFSGQASAKAENIHDTAKYEKDIDEDSACAHITAGGPEHANSQTKEFVVTWDSELNNVYDSPHRGDPNEDLLISVKNIEIRKGDDSGEYNISNIFMKEEGGGGAEHEEWVQWFLENSINVAASTVGVPVPSTPPLADNGVADHWSDGADINVSSDTAGFTLVVDMGTGEKSVENDAPYLIDITMSGDLRRYHSGGDWHVEDFEKTVQLEVKEPN